MTRAADAPTRRERRALERQDRRDDRDSSRRRYRKTKGGPATPAWRSPMVLSTIGALAVGLAIVVFALIQQPQATPPDLELTRPAALIPAGLADGRQLGDADAPVTVEIWSDFQCPACRDLATDVEPAIISAYVVEGTARLVYRDAAFQGQRGRNLSYDESVEAAAGARCAADQGLFWQMHDWLFVNWNGENEGAFRAERLGAIAAAAGVDATGFQACIATDTYQAAVRAETAEAVAAGITSTPTLVINGRSIIGVPSIAQLSALIEQAAQAAVR